jgi:hypothetical protein
MDRQAVRRPDWNFSLRRAADSLQRNVDGLSSVKAPNQTVAISSITRTQKVAVKFISHLNSFQKEIHHEETYHRRHHFFEYRSGRGSLRAGTTEVGIAARSWPARGNHALGQ